MNAREAATTAVRRRVSIRGRLGPLKVSVTRTTRLARWLVPTKTRKARERKRRQHDEEGLDRGTEAVARYHERHGGEQHWEEPQGARGVPRGAGGRADDR